MKQLVRRLIGADRPKVIAVIGITRADAEAGVAHAKTGTEVLPVWAWCAESSESAEPVAGCDRFTAGATAHRVWKDLRSTWPALVIVAWTGKREAASLKLVPLFIPPFRVVIFNEAHGFFAARPASVADHAWRRLRDAGFSAARRGVDWLRGTSKWVRFFVPRTADRIWSLTLAVLGFLAGWTPPLARYAVKQMNRLGTSSESLPVPPCEQSFTEVAILNRGWPRRAIVNAIDHTDAAFVVFRKRGETARAESLIALARETGSFAAAFQTAWTGWPETVATRFPFRRLQPGEVTEVAAPYSSLLVLRRDILLRLEVPRALTYGAGLMLVFRKAQAAGLRAVVAGVSENTGQQPAMALEDAEFALQLAAIRPLRARKAAHPARSRGNVAWSGPHRLPFRGKPRVLIVSPYLPFPLSHGGAVRIYNLCRAMSHDIDFVLACFREVNDTVRYRELHEIFREVYVVDIDEKHPDRNVPDQVAEYRNSAMAELLRNLCATSKIDIVQLEYTQMAEYRAHTGGVPVILVEHDITFTLHRQLSEASPTPAARRQYELWRNFERDALQGANRIWTMSENDRTCAIQHGALPEATIAVPNGVDLNRFRPEPRDVATKSVLFVGSFRHLPNLLAFEALHDIVMPLVWADCPEAELHVIAGPDHALAARLAGRSRLLAPQPRMRVEGFVEDVRKAYRECDVVIIPLPLSAGTNIKLMEAMACGKPVVSTPVGCHGLELRDSMDLLVRDIGPAFAAAIVLLLRDDLLRGSIAQCARRTAEERFDWNAIARSALASYATLLRASPEASQMQGTSI